MTITINRLQAIDLLKQTIVGKEDTVYEKVGPMEMCVYVHEGTPSCLVGQALFRAGVSIEYLEQMDSLDDEPIPGEEDEEGWQPHYAGTGIADFRNTPVLHNETLSLTDGAIDVFDKAQQQQDSRTPFGEAVQYAIINGRGE